MRNRNLDALRAVAILLVLVHHPMVVQAPHPTWLRVFAIRGYVGVDLFFVLSGWLIAGQIFRAMRRNGRIDVAQFWLRRWLRTLPAYYAVASWLALMAIRNSTPVLPFSILLFAQTYTA